MKQYSRVYVEITNVCNRSCSFCLGTKRDKKLLTLDEFDRITDKLVGVTDLLFELED